MSSPGEVELEWWPSGVVPAAASLVWCKFPTHLDLGKPGPKERPALVLKVRYADDPPKGRFLVQVAYGTSNLKLDKRPNDFVIANHTMLDVLRLPQATRFDLDNVLWLPWAKPFFAPRREDDPFCTPVLSPLPDDVKRLLGWTMAARDQRGLNGHLKADPPVRRGVTET